MYISTHHTVEDIAKKPFPDERKLKLCLCKTMMPVLTLGRFVGFFPGTWTHKQDKCVFEKSVFWFIYTVAVNCFYIFQLVHSVDFVNLTSRKSLPILLNDITDAIYGLYVIVLTLTSFVRFPKLLRTLNEMTLLLKDGLFCQSAMKVVLKIQYGFIATIFGIMFCLGSILTWLHLSESYQTNFDYNIYINKVLQIISFIFYITFFTIVSVYIGILGCFEKLTISCLRYTPVHPMKGIDETNNVKDFFGFINYEVCKEKHPCTGKLAQLPAPDVVEHLRILHEEISLSTYDTNSCMNPQFLVHTVVELTVLIIHWYAVIAYIAYDFKSPFARTIHVLNCVFVVFHTIGLFLFLKNAQELKNMVSAILCG